MSTAPRRGSLLVIFLTVFIDLLGFGMVLPLLPIYAQQFTTDESGVMLGALMASFSVMQFLFAPLWGRLSDRIGRRPVLMIGLAGSVIFYSLFGVATVTKNLALLFISRVGAGIAGATIPTAQAYIADTTTLNERAKGMALIGAAFALGFTFGPLFGYLAVPSERGDPGPGPGYAAAGLSAIALLIAYFKLPESLTAKSARAERRWFDIRALRDAVATPSVAALLVALFVCIFAFANFESTLSLLLKGKPGTLTSPFDFDFHQVLLTFTYIGLTLTIAQGLIVRRLAGRIPEGVMAGCGAVVQITGFLLLIGSIGTPTVTRLLIALTMVVFGVSMLMPSLNSLISRRSDPAKQGGILGVAQSVNALARILGPVVGIPLLMHGLALPYWTAAGVMLLGLGLIVKASRGGRDYGLPQPVEQAIH